MGLDQYLIKKTYIGGNFKHREITGSVDLKQEGKEIKNIRVDRIRYIEEEVGYWRKANHIHNWFVKNVQDGVDDCQEYYVTKGNLLELLSVCKKVIENHKVSDLAHVLASELLPTQEGFFFGGTDYDEYYYKSIENTIKIIEDLLPELEEYMFVEIYYRASW